MSCSRCGGLMIEDHYLGMDGQLPMTRCINCGAVMDPRIHVHQTSAVRPRLRRPRQRRPRSLRTPLSALIHDAFSSRTASLDDNRGY